MEMVRDIDKDTVDFAPNYDGRTQEPLILPSRFPNLLVNGSSGIAVGMATNIPPHNLHEVLNAAIALMRDPAATTHDLLQHVPGPDFPTGGIVYGTHGLRQAYETGRGTIQVRGRTHTEQGKRNDRLVITEIPYQLNKTSLIEKIADLVRDKRLTGIGDIRDESDREGMRVVIELRRDANSEVVLNQLYQLTPLQSSFGYNMVAIVSGQPQVLGLRRLLEHFLNHRRDVVTRRSRYELNEAQRRFNIVFGLLAAIDALDRIVALIRSAADQPTAKAALMHEPLPVTPAFAAMCRTLLSFDYPQGQEALERGILRLDADQAQAILDMRLARLTGLERGKLGTEADTLRQTIERLHAILGSQSLLSEVIVGELEAIQKEYSDSRRTELMQDARAISVEDLIADEPMVVTVSNAGYVKRNPIDLYQAQRRGGRGKTAATTRAEDFVENMFVASTHAYVLVFTDRGRVFWLKVHEIPQAGRTSRGKPIVNLINIAADERVAALLPVKTFAEGEYILMCTERGVVKKTDLMMFASPRSAGLQAVRIDAGDRLIHAGVTDGQREILLATRHGMAVRFNESDVRAMGRTARGVRGLTFRIADDTVVGMVISNPARPHVLTVCDNGFGRRASLQDYRLTRRGGLGVINIKAARNGLVAAVSGVDDATEVMLVTNRGMMIRFAVNQLAVHTRAAQGVRVIRMNEGEVVAQVARLAEGSAAQSAANQAQTLSEADALASADDTEAFEPDGAVADDAPEADAKSGDFEGEADNSDEDTEG
jgi:DNA gyrase subunit A